MKAAKNLVVVTAGAFRNDLVDQAPFFCGLGGHKVIAIQRILDALLALSETEIRVEQDPGLLRPIDVPAFHGSPERLRARTGHAPERPLEETLATVLDYWRASVARSPAR